LLSIVCFLILVTFIGSLVHWFIGIATSLPLNSFTSEALTVLYCCLLFQFTSSNMSKNLFGCADF